MDYFLFFMHPTSIMVLFLRVHAWSVVSPVAHLGSPLYNSLTAQVALMRLRK